MMGANNANPDFINQLKVAKVSVQLALEMCGFKTEAGAKLNTIWEELDGLLQDVEEGTI